MRPGIRRATVADAPQIVSLLCEQMTEHSLPSSPSTMAVAVAAVFEEPARGSFLVAEAEGALVGVAYVAQLHSMEHAGTISLLEELFVLATHRGKGLGSALLREAMEQFCFRPGQPMELEVDVTHQPVEALYRRHGFTLRERSRWILRPEAARQGIP